MTPEPKEGTTVRDEVRAVLENWPDHKWQVQGFGMLRTYLPGDTEPRLQVWDQRLACWGNNAIHDHPWAFESTVVAGTVFNQRFHISVRSQTAASRNGHVTDIIPGTRGGQLSERPVKPCWVTPLPVEVYSMGDRYRQTHREMHLTRYVQSSVTLIERFDRETADIARVAWYGAASEQPPFVNPYDARADLIERIVGDALKAWWLNA